MNNYLEILNIRILFLASVLLLSSLPAPAEDGKEPFFSQFRDWYCIAGVPFNNPAGITGETVDVKFQFR